MAVPGRSVAAPARASRVAELSMELGDRIARAREAGLDHSLTFRRVDKPGKESFADARGRMYAAPTAWQARQASQTGGRTVYPLWLPKPIFGLHYNQKLAGITDDWLKGKTYDDWLDSKGNVVGAHTIATPDGQFGAGLLESIEGINDRFRSGSMSEPAARESFLDSNASYISWNKPVSSLTAWDFLDESSDVPIAATAPLRQHLEAMGAGMNPKAMDNVARALQYDNVDGGAAFMLGDGPRATLAHEGTGDLLASLGYAGTLVDDEAGTSVVTFQPHRVRHALRSVIDPSQQGQSGIYRSLLAPVALAAGSGDAWDGSPGDSPK